MHLTLALRNTSGEIQQKPRKQALVHTALACVDVEKWQSNLERERSVLVHLEVISKKKHEVFIQVLILEKWRQTKNTNEK